MPGLPVDACRQVERLREIVGSENNYAVQIMPPPSYLQALLYERNPDSDLTPDIVLVYRTNIKTSTSSLPLDVRDQINESFESDNDLGGNPLPAPFENDDIDVSVSEQNQYQWPKGEVNQLPIQMCDAINILNHSRDATCDDLNALDVWCLVGSDNSKQSPGLQSPSNNSYVNRSITVSGQSLLDGSMSSSFLVKNTNQKRRIMLCQHVSGESWSRSYVESQGTCSIASPEMDPQTMKKSHLDIGQMPELMMNAVVLCRYNIDGQRVISDASSSPSAFSVKLELKWRQLSLSVPHQEASAKVIIQAAVGHKSSQAHTLFRQLYVLHKLFDLYFACWSNKTSPEALPFLDLSEETLGKAFHEDSLHCRIKTLICGGQQALQAQNANRRMSVAPALVGRQSIAPRGFLDRQSMAPGGLGRQSIAPGFLSRKSIAPGVNKESSTDERKAVTLSEATEIVGAGIRENSDLTDGLFSLLVECKSYRELTSAWDFVFMELNQAKMPYIRPKNDTRAAKLIRSFVSGKSDTTNFLDIEGSLFPLELIIEMGLEKLTTDYYYIFRESQLVGRDELQAPVLLQSGLGVPREKWVISCSQSLSWLAQVHSALELVIPLPNSLSAKTVRFVASKALKHFQSETSPVRDVAGLLSSEGCVQEFSIDVSADAVHEHTNKKFDWWRMTLTSECALKKVRSVFLRSHLRPIFPPQLCEDFETLVPSENNSLYYCAEAVTITDKF
ncbi:Protein zwilch-like protein [Frankliniella fusca]|uniref:Protein zwilch n=1 Tax=Frankliniella fusca TaxID=407009 RepID=A0AAE1LHV5_9NEOP|nr:Protein zwilch-like protein [Frankliniella fusca]